MSKKYSSADLLMVKRSIELAKEGIGKGGGPFGAVIAGNGDVISEAFNEVVISSDPSAHAEVLAIRRACEKLGTHNLGGMTLYASCEPCPMCLGAIYWAGISRVFYASGRHDASVAGFGDEEFYAEIGKSPDERKIPFIQVEEAEGKEVFAAWERNDKKIRY